MYILVLVIFSCIDETCNTYTIQQLSHNSRVPNIYPRRNLSLAEYSLLVHTTSLYISIYMNIPVETSGTKWVRDVLCLCKVLLGDVSMCVLAECVVSYDDITLAEL